MKGEGLTNEWTDGRTDGRTEGRTNKQKSPYVLQDFVPFGAAVQKERKRKFGENKAFGSTKS